MERIERILKHPLFKQLQSQLDIYEKDRIYCKHGISHSLDVARIMYIRALENHFDYDKAVIYAAALLHDLGRCRQYESGEPHHEASVMIAKEILPQCGFVEEEACILDAIRKHRTKEEETGMSLSSLLYAADKESRNCFYCQAVDTCNWNLEKRNITILN